ncbi:hypothetical protein M514_11310 [Trichuris suis]|uniref:Uncharacterized protein n=1 Tax=Trichuris suis TaxID=68888 RepID=A0A085MXQ9_9BILA|nr:hypothetical protein M513_11310 [Trichuris suis]KFD62005.1 hypothetical protein M514_11310 [Trichuris suis]
MKSLTRVEVKSNGVLQREAEPIKEVVEEIVPKTQQKTGAANGAIQLVLVTQNGGNGSIYGDIPEAIESQQQIEAQRRQIEVLLSRLPVASATPPTLASSFLSFAAFDATSELWKDYWARFKTFARANSIPEDKLAQVFLTNQATAIFKLLSTLAGQQ